MSTESKVIGRVNFKSQVGEDTGHVEVRLTGPGRVVLEIARGDGVAGSYFTQDQARTIGQLLISASVPR